jgi:hypothetical protein
MTPLPPPSPIDEPTTPPPTRSRRRLVIAAVAATALGVGGVVAGSQLVAADDENTTDESTPADDAEPVDVVDPIDDDPIDEADSDDDASDDGDMSDDDEHNGDWGLPALDELTTSFEEFQQCLAAQLPDLEDGGWLDLEGGELPDIGDWDQEFEDLLGGSVTVFSPGAEDGDLTLLDFGDGDGTITISQTDGMITVSTDGDVETVDAGMPDLSDLDLSDFDLSDFDLSNFEFEPDPEVGAAFENCASLLPGDGIFDMVGELVGDFD